VDGQRFDDLARSLANGISRRGLLKVIAGAAASAVFVRWPTGRAAGQDSGVSCPLRLGQSCTDASGCGGDACPTYDCCGGVCVDLATDPANCGTCGTTCDTGNCVENTCCPAGAILCGDACVDPTADTNNCGGCGVVCPPGQPCLAGVCGCAPPAVACGNGCVDITSDPNNCASCGVACDSGQPCCNAVCIAIATDRTNCGACGNVCPDSAPTCCGGACTDTTSDPANCGACGTTCGDRTCSGGACAGASPTATATAPACPAGQTACGDACADLSSDPANCGGCGQTCQGGGACDNGQCATSPPTPEPTSPPPPEPTSPPRPSPTPCSVGQDPTRQTVSLSLASERDKLALDQTTTQRLPGGETTTTIDLRLAGNPLVQVDATTSADGTRVNVQYGAAVRGIKQATFSSTDGKTIQGAIDGRAILPFPIGADPHSVRFADGAPPPIVKVKGSTEKAVTRLLKQAHDATATCAPPPVPATPTATRPPKGSAARLLLAPEALQTGEPGHHSFPETSAGCLGCEAVCASAEGICIAVGETGCAASLFFYGLCLAGVLIGCGSIAAGCVAACHVPNFPCCPVTCGHGLGSCCDAGEACLDPTNHVCCAEGLVPCNGISCCHPGDTCLSDGTCCPGGQATCLNVCCQPGEACQNNSVCCPPSQAVCLSACCQPGEVCNNGQCCPTGKVCGPNCCDALDDCIDAGRGVCCGGLNKPCNGTCCGPDDECVNGACCPLGQVCGNVCCPAHTSCTDFATGKCAACSHPDWVPCRAKGEPTCCPSLNQCCQNGVCCDIGSPCGWTGTAWKCGAGIIR
jgi:Stigma-specific protein, Stig1